jgi:hypothetical protein
VDPEDIDRLVRETSRDGLPRLLGVLVEGAARVRLRLAEVPQQSVSEAAPRAITADEAAAIAGTSKRWILANTRGLRCRVDLSRKQPRLDEESFRGWLRDRRR